MRIHIWLAIFILPQFCAVAAAQTLGNIHEPNEASPLEPVVLGWPEFEPVPNAAEDSESFDEPSMPPSTPRRAAKPVSNAEAPRAVSNLGALARNVIRAVPDDGDYSGAISEGGPTAPWIVPSGNEDPQPSIDGGYVDPGPGFPSPAPPVDGMMQPVDPMLQQPAPGENYPAYVVTNPEACWTQQWMPDGLMFHNFLAGEKEPRFASVWLNDPDRGMVWETALGGRLGIWRYGSEGAMNPEGWQFDLEGGVLTRLDPEEETDVDAADFVIGLLMTRRIGKNAIQFGYGHLSSHVGDEYLIKHPTFQRINYVRDSVLFGLAHNITPDVRIYGEIAYAPGAEDGAEPLEAQAGAEYSPAKPYLSPFAAVNLHYREEFGFQASVNIVAGWQIRSPTTNRLFRFGLQHYNGKSLQYEFLDQYETLTGAGLWVDF